MLLKQLLDGLNVSKTINLDTNIDIKGITDNSSQADQDFVFIAIRGVQSDGHSFIEEAIHNGASVIIGEKPVTDHSVPYIQVENSRKALGIIAKNYYGNPAKNKIMIGITGTNGKTTTSYLIKHILEQNGITCSLFGTIENIINSESFKSYNTTPSSLMLHEFLSKSRDDAVIMEVSSHGLAQHRVEGILFDVALFTNLDHEHLDFHPTMEDYFQTKLKLFDHLKENGLAVINADNPWGEKLVSILKTRGTDVCSIGQSDSNSLCIECFHLENSSVSVKEDREIYKLISPLIGIHNIYNVLMAYQTARQIGISKQQIIQSLKQFAGVKGRFEKYKHVNGATIIVDYAHTQEAVFHCLNTARQHGAKRIFHIFGFRGNRDISKRKDMVAVSSELSDRFILTFDDLNSVAAREMADVLHSLNVAYGKGKGMVILDRTLAIKWAMDHSSSNDWIIITGKGHEKYEQNFALPSRCDTETVLYIAGQVNVK